MLKTTLKHFFLIFMSATFLCSCSTHKWKSKYTERRITDFQKKYFIGGSEFVMAASPQPLSSTKPVRDMSRKQLKKNMALLEYVLVIVPDSIRKTGEKIDSIYSNKYKIKYIKKNRLQSSNMYFVR